MNWSEFKTLVESQGVTDEVQIGSINVNYVRGPFTNPPLQVQIDHGSESAETWTAFIVGGVWDVHSDSEISSR